ncbi:MULTISPECIES: hypothetical protein [Acinetobacter calcoaceticus/baumannii complex]|nr:hypothetical protein [Acinetobacter baumannii]MBU3166734.1 hypothetical protein [Acinetobacter baumannii]MDV7575915.1 hypothetical protein [Acinetobacter baumannii]
MNIPNYLIRRESEIVPLSEQQLSNIYEFRRRVENYYEALNRYQVLAMSKHLISDNVEIRKATFEANTPDIDHIQNLALKFRFFYADREPTKLESIINLLRRQAQDEWARNYLDLLRMQYNGIMNSCDISKNMGLAVSNREIINLWFNSDFFHSDVDKRKKLNDINQSISEEVSLFQLYLAITSVSVQLKLVYAVTHRISLDENIICTPNHHFKQNSSAN